MMTFVTIMRTEGDAVRAAEILCVNQPSMSKRLAFLQHAGPILRKPWVERIGKDWRLTPEGRRVLPAVEELVHRYRLLKESLEESRPDVVFGCGSSGAAGFVREAIRSYRSRRPTGTFRISTRPAIARVECVANGSFDLACVRLETHEILDLAHRPLFVEELYSDPLVLIAASSVDGFQEFQAMPEKGATPKALTCFPLILPEPDSGLRRDFDRCCREAGVHDRLNVVVEVSPWTSVLNFVRDGVGVGIVPRSAALAQNGLHIKPLPGKLSPASAVRVICRKRAGTDDLDLAEGALEFLQALRDAAKGFDY